MRLKFYSLFVLFFSIVLISSCKSDGEDNNSQPEILFTTAPEDLGKYDVGILDKSRSLLLFADYYDNTSCVKKLDCISGDDLLSFSFNEEGLPESIMTYNDSIVISFGKYTETGFDAVVSYEGEIYYVENIEIPEALSRNISYVSATRGGDKVTISDNLKYVGGIVANLVSSFIQVAQGHNYAAALKYIEAHVRTFMPVLSEFASDFINESTEIGVFGLQTASFLETAGSAAASGTALATLGTSLAWLSAAYGAYNVGEILGEHLAELQIQLTELLENQKGMLSSGNGALKVTLSWNFYADIDLHAYEPGGDHIYFANPVSYYSDGYLDVDNTRGGPGAIENIYWENPLAGVYEFYLDYFDGEQSGTCTCTVTYKGKGTQYRVPMTEGSWDNFAKLLVNNNTRSVENKQRIKMEVHIKPDKNKKSTEPIVVFRRER